jgi:hypothetical protein
MDTKVLKGKKVRKYVKRALRRWTRAVRGMQGQQGVFYEPWREYVRWTHGTQPLVQAWWEERRLA